MAAGNNNTLDKTNFIPTNGPGRAGFAVKRSTGIVTIRRGGNLDQQTVSADGVLPVSAAPFGITLTYKDDGLTVLGNLAGAGNSTLVTLPLAKAGVRFTVGTLIVPGSVGTTITPNAADKFQGNGKGGKTNGQALVNTFGTAVVGDLVELIGTDSNIWLVKTIIGTWA